MKTMLMSALMFVSFAAGGAAAADLPLDMKLPLPANEHVVHFGKGQTETQVTLPPGKHTLQLVFANYLHIPHDPPVVSPRITVTVK